MTLQQLEQCEPQANGKFVIDAELFNELKACYIRAQVLAKIEKSRQQIKEGKVVSADEFFSEMRKKYGYKI